MCRLSLSKLCHTLLIMIVHWHLCPLMSQDFSFWQFFVDPPPSSSLSLADYPPWPPSWSPPWLFGGPSFIVPSSIIFLVPFLFYIPLCSTYVSDLVRIFKFLLISFGLQLYFRTDMALTFQVGYLINRLLVYFRCLSTLHWTDETHLPACSEL